jgi:hypothetical protein
MTDFRDQIPPRQEQAIIGMVLYPTLAQAAAHAGVTPRTLLRWRRNKHFQDALYAARRNASRWTKTFVADNKHAVLECMRNLLDEGPPAIRLAAAQALWNHVGKFDSLINIIDHCPTIDLAIDVSYDDEVAKALSKCPPDPDEVPKSVHRLTGTDGP